MATRAEQAGAHLESVDDRIEAVNQRMTQLPATLAIPEQVGELIQTHSGEQAERLAAATETLTELVRSRPDHDELAGTVSGIVNPATEDLNKRLGALEETMLALAEALLRPTRPKD